MLHGVDGGGHRRHLVADRLVHVTADQAVDGPVEGRREQQRLVGSLETPEHPLDLGHEPHVGHAVRLVEHQGLDVGHRKLAPVAEVDEPPGSRDHHVDPATHLLDLPLDVGAAVDRGGPKAVLAPRAARAPRSPGVPARGWAPGPARADGRASRIARPWCAAGAAPRTRGSCPDPVFALPHTSRPASASATVIAWMGKGTVMPCSESASTRSGSTPSEAKLRGSPSTSSSRTRSVGSLIAVIWSVAHSRLFRCVPVRGRGSVARCRVRHGSVGPAPGLVRVVVRETLGTGEEDPGRGRTSLDHTPF